MGPAEGVRGPSIRCRVLPDASSGLLSGIKKSFSFDRPRAAFQLEASSSSRFASCVSSQSRAKAAALVQVGF